MQKHRIIAFGTKGAGSNEEARIRELLRTHSIEVFPFDRRHKVTMFRQLLAKFWRERPNLVVMEGTGVAGGVACMLARLMLGTRYIVSSGDAIGPYVRSRALVPSPLFALYERCLCRLCAGFIGWTPYLVGRALTFGAPRAMTAAGWSHFERSPEQCVQARARVREMLGIREDDIVFGIIGNLFWTRRFGYCYGHELVRAIQLTQRDDVKVLICGGGTGLERLHALAGPLLDKRVFLTGGIPWDQVLDYLSAMDVGSLPQSVDALGSFRYTTKLSEYIAARLPIVTGALPLAYDLDDDGWIWRLPGRFPWGDQYVRSLAGLMGRVDRVEIDAKRNAIPKCLREFDAAGQSARVGRFVDDIMSDGAPGHVVAPGRNARPAPRRLLSIAHSYVVAMNRTLVHEIIGAGAGRWEVTAVAPDYFHGVRDLRPLTFEARDDEPFRVEVVPAHLSRFVHVFHYGRKLRGILAEGWDLVHCWEEPYINVGWQVARWTPRDVPLIYRTAQSIDKFYPPPFNWMERYNMRRAAGWICSGTLVRDMLSAKPMYARRPMRMIPLGVDVNVFMPDVAAGRDVRRRLGWPEEPGSPVVGYLGRFVRDKGLHLLMNTLDRLTTPWRAMFVGGGPSESELRTWARRHGTRVVICTDVRHAQVPQYLNAMDVMCAPSQTTRHWREQFGRMLIEAFACGVPVVGSDSGEIPFVIDKAGIVCGEQDLDRWVIELDQLLGSKERRTELGDLGLERARQNYAWPIVARNYVDFFDQILEDHPVRNQSTWQ